jgi:signal transduction histidine kinase/CheY-like chemotaxis protein
LRYRRRLLPDFPGKELRMSWPRVVTYQPFHEDAIDVASFEWGELQLLFGGPFVLGVLLIMVEPPLNIPFSHPILPGNHLSFTGLLLVVNSIVAYSFTRFSKRLGKLALVWGMLAITLLFLFFGPGPGALSLLLLPILWSFLGDMRQELPLGLALIVVCALGSGYLYAAAPVERSIVLLLAGVLFLTNLRVRLRRQQAVQSLSIYYRQARDQLAQARDARLSLHQAKDDLANAYVQLRRLNELLQASKLEAESARRVKEEFVARVSHELRTPLNMILGFSEMIMRSPASYGPSLPQALLADMRVIYRNSRHLLQLINDVLALSQTEAGQMHLSRSWTDIGDVVREAVAAVQPLFKSKQLTLCVQIPDKVAPVWCDHLRIRQVLLNLLSNAGRFTQAGEVSVHVQASSEQIVVSVSDSGPGIAPEEQALVFDPFHQTSESARQPGSGSGLGLTISRQLVELHGGKMWLESALGQGATFSFSLPHNIYRSAPAASPHRWINEYSTYQEGERRALPALPAAKPRLVVFEQQHDLCDAAGQYLDDSEIALVHSAAELEEECARLPPAAILINNASAMEDRTFSHHLGKLPHRIPIISCYVPGRQEALDRLQVVDYLVKPVARDELLAVVQRHAPPASLILIIEDNLEMAFLIRRQLESSGLGYRVAQVTDGGAALRYLQEHCPALILLDLALPNQDGHQVLRRKNHDARLAAIPVIVVSARNPVGEPVVASRLRVELGGGLSIRDILHCTEVISHAFSPASSSANRASPETASG